MSVFAGKVEERLIEEIKKFHTEIAGHTIILGSILTTLKSMEQTLGEIRDK